RLGKRIESVGTDTLELLAAYPWPGNIRELENVLERAVILADGHELEIDPDVLPVAGGVPESGPSGGGEQSLVAVERDHILSVLRQTDWVIEGPGGAAKVLAMHPNTLRSRLKKLGISRPAHGAQPRHDRAWPHEISWAVPSSITPDRPTRTPNPLFQGTRCQSLAPRRAVRMRFRHAGRFVTLRSKPNSLEASDHDHPRGCERRLVARIEPG